MIAVAHYSRDKPGNVVYAWISNGVYGTLHPAGDATAAFPVFRIDTGTIPTGAEELIMYDSTDTVNGGLHTVIWRV
jgi:hypothetical protein